MRTRLHVSPEDAQVLRAVGRHLGSLAGRDLAARCAEGRLDAKGRAASRAIRKRALTTESSSRWAGAITRTSEDAYQLASRNLAAERGTLKARVRKIKARLAVQSGKKNGRVTGYATPAERHSKTLRLKALEGRTAPEDAVRPAQVRPRKHPAAVAASRKPAAPRGTRPPTGSKTGMRHRTVAGTQAAEDRSRSPAEPALTIARC